MLTPQAARGTKLREVPEREKFLSFGPARACPLCGSGEHFILSRSMQFRLDCTTVICKGCGFCFVSPAPTEAACRSFYRDAYAHYYGGIHPILEPESVRETPEETERFGTIERCRRVSGSRLLEIGPGNGRFLVLASRRGARCHAIEPSQEFRSRLASMGITPVGEFLETTPAAKSYDIIVLFQVLEHFHDPVASVRAICELLNDDGILVLDVPNIWKPYRSLDRHFLRYVHLSYFSPLSLGRLLQSQGLELLHMDTADRRSIHYPRPVFAIAGRVKLGGRPRDESPPEDWRRLARFLRGYRLSYPVFIAPRMMSRAWKARLRRVLRESDRNRPDRRQRTP